MPQLTRPVREAQMQAIWRLLMQSKSNEEIANELGISYITVSRYVKMIDHRYGQEQRKKTDDTIFMECQLFKSRLLSLFRGLESVVNSTNPNVTGTDRAKCAEVAANLAIDVLKMESEGIKAVREIIQYGKGSKSQQYLQSVQRRILADNGDSDEPTTNRENNNSESIDQSDNNPNAVF